MAKLDTKHNNNTEAFDCSIDFSGLDYEADKSLRGYQIDNKRKIYEAWQKYRAVMLQMPTGTGKTRLFVSIARDLHNYGVEHKQAIRILFLAHRKELIEQISEHVGEKYHLAHGLIVAQRIEEKDKPVQVGSVPTLNRRLEGWGDKDFDVIIIDEAHHVKAMSYRKIIDFYPNAKLLGVTATPYRLNGAGFHPEFDELIVSASVAEFIKKRYLSEYVYYSIKPTSRLQNEIDKMKLDFQGDYEEKAMMGVMDRDYIRAGILSTYQRFAKGKKGIVYTISRAHNDHLSAEFNAAGIKSAAIDSDTPKEEREKLVSKFRNGDIQVLFNVNIFSEGFDCPDVEVIQLARPTKSLAMYLQQVGRGLRPHESKDNLIILDNVGLFNKFGFPSARRKWKHHFEGRPVDESPEAHRFERDDENRRVYDIYEGDEPVEILHDSRTEEIGQSVLDDIEQSQIENPALDNTEAEINEMMIPTEQAMDSRDNTEFLIPDNSLDNNMKETLIQVAEAIKEAQPIYYAEHIPVVARIHGDFDGNERTIWFQIGSSNKSMLSMSPEVQKLGRLVSKNSYIATRILNSNVGDDIDYQQRSELKRLENHHIKTTSKADLENKEISICNDFQKYTYLDISVFLEALRVNQAEIERVDKEIEEQRRRYDALKEQDKDNTAHERSIITKGIKKIEEERRILTLQQEEMDQLTRYIRQQGKLRFNPILDPVQNRIKTQNLFNGVTVVIDGGPGTGKTTTMIQRLKYLTDSYAIEEDFVNETNLYQLTVAQRDNLNQAIKEHRDWIFFSPSKLLKEYLKDAMNREGLANTSAKVWNWAEYRNTVLLEDYRLFDPSNDAAPFKAGRSTEVLFNDCSGVINGFSEYFIENLKQIKKKLPKIEENAKQYRWENVAINIKNRLEEAEGYNKLSQFIHLFNSLEQLYSQDCWELLTENRTLLKQISEEIYLLSKENKSIYDKLVSLANIQVAEQNDEAEEEQESVDNLEVKNEELDTKIIDMIRTWFKRLCHSKKNKDIHLTQRQEQLSELLMPVVTEEHKSRMDRVGELALFEQYAKYTRGLKSNLFVGLAGKYKRFRRQAWTQKDNKWNLTELEAMLKRRGGNELHPQEQSLLIGFINNLVKEVLRINREKINHPFIEAYQELARPIIGVDEATDFSECDIYAMQSLLNNDYNSFTLCGDLMQRLTHHGITSWNSIQPYVGNMKLMKMTTSYRQSSSLLKVARALYSDTIGGEPDYKAYMKSTKVPEPLTFTSKDEDTKIEWIEKRIKEVYIAYGKKLPSIAIFMNNKYAIAEFVDKLKNTDFILDSGIEIVDGSGGNVLESNHQIRVYPIDVVKGMEFDVVFFHNIDDAVGDTDLIKRYIYVGVSRAAFFLGITLNADKQDITKYFKSGLNWSKV